MLIDGRYALLRCLGRGGMAEVYLAKQFGPLGFEKLVVVKRALRKPDTPPKQQASFDALFESEARLAADLRHPNIVGVQEVLIHDGVPHIVMQYLHGVDLSRVLRRCRRRNAPLGLEPALFIAQRMAAALYAAHSHQGADGTPCGIIHRDVTPQNIVVTFEGQPVLVDFGIARATARPIAGEPLRGKIGYFAPEQIAGDDASTQSDQFVLGIVLYEMLSGRRLFFHKGEEKRSLRENLVATIPPVSFPEGALPAPIDDVLRRMLARRPSERYASCEAVVDALDAAGTAIGLAPRIVSLRRRIRQLFADVLDVDHNDASQGPPVADTHHAQSALSSPAPASDAPDAATQAPTAPLSPPALALRLPPARQSDYRVLRRLIKKHAIVGIHGAPGVGKSTLGHVLHRDIQPSRYIELSESASLAAVSAAIGNRPSPRVRDDEDATRALRDALAGRPPNEVLFVDGISIAVADAVAQTAHTLGRRVVLLTRAAPAEPALSYLVQPLSCRAAAPGVLSDAASFFVDHCGRDYTKQDWALIEEVVDAVDGLPHGLVLAAAHAEQASLSQLKTWLFDHGAAADRLQALVASAVDELPQVARGVLNALALMPGVFDAEDAERVSGRPDALRAVLQLCDAGLCRMVTRAGLEDEVHFDIFRNVELCVLETLDTAARDTLRRQRDAAVLDRAERWYRSSNGPGTERALARLRSVAGTLRAIRDEAMRGAAHDDEDAASAARAALYLDLAHGGAAQSGDDARALNDIVLFGATRLPMRLYAQLLEADADTQRERGALPEAKARYLLALAAARQADAPELSCLALKNLIDVNVVLAQFDDAAACATEALATCQKIGDRHMQARLGHSITRLHLKQESFDKALLESERALEVFRHVGDVRFEARALRRRADILLALAAFEDAERHLLRALELHRACGERAQEAKTRLRYGLLLWAAHRDERGARRELHLTQSLWRALSRPTREAATLKTIRPLPFITPEERIEIDDRLALLTPPQ